MRTELAETQAHLLKIESMQHGSAAPSGNTNRTFAATSSPSTFNKPPREGVLILSIPSKSDIDAVGAWVENWLLEQAISADFTIRSLGRAAAKAWEVDLGDAINVSGKISQILHHLKDSSGKWVE